MGKTDNCTKELGISVKTVFDGRQTGVPKAHQQTIPAGYGREEQN